MEYRVIIKGSLSEALEALMKRRFNLIETGRASDSYGSVSLLVKPSAGIEGGPALGYWFNAAPACAPYPSGTLLWFSAKKATSEPAEERKAGTPSCSTAERHRTVVVGRDLDELERRIDARLDRIDNQISTLYARG